MAQAASSVSDLSTTSSDMEWTLRSGSSSSSPASTSSASSIGSDLIQRQVEKTSTTFSSLPLEIRWMIYRHYLAKTPTVHSSCTDTHSQTILYKEPLVDDQRLSLFRVSRQIYQELMPFYFFEMRMDIGHIDLLHKLTISSNLFQQNVRHLILDMLQPVTITDLQQLPSLQILVMRDVSPHHAQIRQNEDIEQTIYREIVKGGPPQVIWRRHDIPFIYHSLNLLHHAIANNSAIGRNGGGVQLRVRFQVQFDEFNKRGGLLCRRHHAIEYRYKDDTFHFLHAYEWCTPRGMNINRF